MPPGVFVFLCDVDFLPSRGLHADLVTGKHRGELLHMHTNFTAFGHRGALVLPAFERLAHVTSSEPGAVAHGDSNAGRAWAGAACEADAGCEMVQGIAVPRTFETLREMLSEVEIVDVFDRYSVRSERHR